MPMNKSFNIAMPNKPYVEDFSENKVQAATYIGPRYLKVQYHNDTKYIANIINEGDTMEDLNEGPSAVMENHTSTVIDADSDTLVAAYLNNMYETGEVADYSEDLGTTDENGDAEKWTFTWHDGSGVIAQIYNQGTMKFEDGAIVEPTVRVHSISEADFTESVNGHIANATTEAARDVYSDEEKTAINAYKSTLEGLSTKYSGKDHWKIPFPQQPDYK